MNATSGLKPLVVGSRLGLPNIVRLGHHKGLKSCEGASITRLLFPKHRLRLGVLTCPAYGCLHHQIPTTNAPRQMLPSGDLPSGCRRAVFRP